MSWRNLLDNITTLDELKEYLDLSDEESRNIQEEISKFPMSVSRYYLSLIDPEDPEDPIRKMAIPSGKPLVLDGSLDTSGEKSNTVIQGAQHKYAQTVLVMTTSECAMYCRHCFRRRIVGTCDEEIATDCHAVKEYIKAHPEVNNVLLPQTDSFCPHS